ncbi:MAG: glycosyltransferase WbuB [Gemmatimonadetes bacterium]|nr:glycosyltransferase WbuB [Gemmatimonadota bacterium]
MRVALIAVAYPPARYSVAVQMQDLAHEFMAQGHEPTVMVPDETLGRPWTLEAVDGIQVLRLRAPRTRDTGYLRRTVAEMALPWAMLRGLRKSPLAATRWDGVVWYSPSIFFGPLVSALKQASNCRSYLILRDIFPEWAVDLGLMRRGLAYRVFKMFERQQHNAADVIGIQAPSNGPYLEHLGQKQGLRIEVLWNWLAPAPDTGCSISVAATTLASRTIFVYAGNMGVAQAPDALVDLAERLKHRKDIGFLFVGRGSELPRLRASAERLGLDNVLFRDEIDPAEVPGLLAQCHVGLVALDVRHRTHNIPGKFLAYLRAGLPVLARTNANNDLVGLIENGGVGRVVVDDAVEALRTVAESMADDRAGREVMASQGREMAGTLFAPGTAVKQIVAGLQGGERRENP